MEQGDIVQDFLGSVVVNKANSDNLVAAILKLLRDDDLPLDNLIQIMSDSPSVMRGAVRGVVTVIKRDHAPHLIDISGCSLHTVSNAVKGALEKLDLYDELEEFVQDVSSFMKSHISLTDEFSVLQEELELSQHRVLRFVEVRFLSMFSVVLRLIEQYPALKAFFLEHIPKKHPQLLKKPQVKRISGMLQRKQTLVSLHFIGYALDKFQKYEKLFQRKESTIHMMYDEQVDLFRSVLLSFCTFSEIEKLKTAADLTSFKFTDVKVQMNETDIKMGSYVSKELGALKDSNKTYFCRGVKKFYLHLAEYLKTHLPLTNQDLADLRSLSPLSRDDKSQEAMLRLAKKLPPGCGLENPLTTKEEDALEEEYTRYRLEDVSEEWIKNTDDLGETAYVSIGHYWSKIIQMKDNNGDDKYPLLSVVVSALLAISEANGEVERSFKDLKDFITDDRNRLGEYTLNGLMTTKYHIRAENLKCSSYPMNTDLLDKVRGSHSHYEERIQKVREIEKKKIKEREETKIRSELMKKLRENEKEKTRLQALKEIDKSAEDQLKESMKQRMEAMNMLKAAQEKIKTADALAKKADMQKKEVNLVKTSLANKRQKDSVKKAAREIHQSLLTQQRSESSTSSEKVVSAFGPSSSKKCRLE